MNYMHSKISLFKTRILVFTLIVLISANLCGQVQKYAVLKDFVFESGEMIKECKVGYRTYGRMNQDKTNIVMYCTWFNGLSSSLGSLVGAGKIVDTADYFVIAVDALGNGVSTSPSNYNNTGSKFPALRITDMVHSQYRLLTEEFGVRHVFALIGGSMGSMQVLEWAVRYPDFADKVVAYVCTPKLTSYDLLWMNWMTDKVNAGRQCSKSDAEIWKDINIMNAMLARTPEYVVSHITADTFSSYYGSMLKVPSATSNLSNYLSQMEAMIHHDIFRKNHGSMTETAKVIKSKILMLLSTEDHLIRPETSLEFQKILKNKIEIINNQGGHLSIGQDLKKVSAIISDFLKN